MTGEMFGRVILLSAFIPHINFVEIIREFGIIDFSS